mmetsp:Transcript_65533/g.152209  ORF Transcript_65533/g.152209 Transcript_65533/m.152209 type:complete len:226 (-) Transcript_65533:111-788(-)
MQLARLPGLQRAQGAMVLVLGLTMPCPARGKTLVTQRQGAAGDAQLLDPFASLEDEYDDTHTSSRGEDSTSAVRTGIIALAMALAGYRYCSSQATSESEDCFRREASGDHRPSLEWETTECKVLRYNQPCVASESDPDQVTHALEDNAELENAEEYYRFERRAEQQVEESLKNECKAARESEYEKAMASMYDSLFDELLKSQDKSQIRRSPSKRAAGALCGPEGA